MAFLGVLLGGGLVVVGYFATAPARPAAPQQVDAPDKVVTAPAPAPVLPKPAPAASEPVVVADAPSLEAPKVEAPRDEPKPPPAPHRPRPAPVAAAAAKEKEREREKPAEEEAIPAGEGRLRITANPPSVNAKVQVGPDDWGLAPVDRKLASGRYVVSLKLADGRRAPPWKVSVMPDRITALIYDVESQRWSSR